jgi:hypothetical protein
VVRRVGRAWMSPVRGQQGFDDLDSVATCLAQVPACPVSGLHDLAQWSRGSRQFLTDRSAKKTGLVKYAYFGHIAGVVPEDHGLAHVGRQGRVYVTHAKEPEAIATHFARLHHRQQQ